MFYPFHQMSQKSGIPLTFLCLLPLNLSPNVFFTTTTKSHQMQHYRKSSYFILYNFYPGQIRFFFFPPVIGYPEDTQSERKAYRI